jgi:hypothetical protein
MNTRLVITSLAPPGVVIQLDGRAAERLAMTPWGFIALSRNRSPFLWVLAMTMQKEFICSLFRTVRRSLELSQ